MFVTELYIKILDCLAEYAAWGWARPKGRNAMVCATFQTASMLNPPTVTHAFGSQTARRLCDTLAVSNVPCTGQDASGRLGYLSGRAAGLRMCITQFLSNAREQSNHKFPQTPQHDAKYRTLLSRRNYGGY